MPVITRSQKKAQVQTPFQGNPEPKPVVIIISNRCQCTRHKAATKAETKAETKAATTQETIPEKPQEKKPETKPQTSLGIWYMETLNKYTNLSSEISNKMRIYRTCERYAAYRAMIIEQLRIAIETYHIITEYFPEVMNTESDIFVSSHKKLVKKSIEISKRNLGKLFSPKTNEELEIILAFEDVLRAADEMFNPREEVSIFEEEVLEVKEEEALEEGEEDEDLDEDYEEEEEDEEEDALDEALEEEIYELMMEQKNEYQNSHIRFVYADDE
jgi:hypothetical protein